MDKTVVCVSGEEVVGRSVSDALHALHRDGIVTLKVCYGDAISHTTFVVVRSAGPGLGYTVSVKYKDYTIDEYTANHACAALYMANGYFLAA